MRDPSAFIPINYSPVIDIFYAIYIDIGAEWSDEK
jgi:hypothetical protein